jgi:hypothetical protein
VPAVDEVEPSAAEDDALLADGDSELLSADDDDELPAAGEDGGLLAAHEDGGLLSADDDDELPAADEDEELSVTDADGDTPAGADEPPAPALDAVWAAPATAPDAASTLPAAVPVDGWLERMNEIQLGFVDEPRQAALEAENLLAEVLQSFADELTRQRDALRGASDGAVADTERMRLAVRRSRELIDALTNVG